jgi:ribosomal protein S12 methylthiotransferase
MELGKSAVRKKICLVSLGCAKNLVDSEVMQGSLLQSGYTFTSRKEDAEIILVNTCAFIEEATRESIETILEISRQKRIGSCRALVVCGCLPQRYQETLIHELPEVDLFLGSGEVQNIVRHLKKLNKGINGVKLFASRPSFLLSSRSPRILATPSHSAYIKIAEGCSHRCTYCIIPKIKGPYRSRSPRSIITEVKRLTKSVSKNVISYHRILPNMACVQMVRAVLRDF